MNLKLLISEYSVGFMEMLIFYFFSETRLRCANKSRRRYLTQVLFFVVMSVIQNIIIYFSASPLPLAVTTTLLYILFSFVFYTDSALTKIFWGFLYSVICVVSEFLSMLILRIALSAGAQTMLPGERLHLPFLAVSAGLTVLFTFMLRKISVQKFSPSLIQKLIYAGIACVGIAAVYYMMSLINAVNESDGGPYPVTGMLVICLMFVFVFLSFFSYIFQLNVADQKNIEMIKERELVKQGEMEYRQLAEKNQTLREVRHDINLHLDVIKSMVENGKTSDLPAYIENVRDLVVTAGKGVASGNTVIDNVLSHYIERAKRQGIEVEYSAIIPSGYPLNESYTVSLLGNLWNNALEACKRLSERDESLNPYIKFYIKPYMDFVLIHMENPFDGLVKKNSDGKYLSIKEGEEHGFGLKRVQSIARQVGGEAVIETNENIFIVHIAIPMKEPSNEC